MSNLEKFGLAFIVVIGLVGFVACTELTSNDEISEQSDTRDYHYADGVKINHGFYKDYSCIILREYNHTVFCELAATPDGQSLQDKYKSHINVPKRDITMIP